MCIGVCASVCVCAVHRNMERSCEAALTVQDELLSIACND